MDWPEIMFGTGASSEKDYERLHRLIKVALESGIRGYDTAPSYATEDMLGHILREQSKMLGINREELVIQTKIDPWQMQDGRVEEFVSSVLQKMGLDYLDALLIHWPVLEYLDDTWGKMVELKGKGLVKHLGICNVRLRHLQKVNCYDVKPEVVQIERHPLRTCVEETVFCQEHGLLQQSYSPLCKMDSRICNSERIIKIAERCHVSVGMVVLRWHLDTGTVPIFTSKKEERIREYANLQNFTLSAEEIKEIESLNENYKLYLESLICPGF